MNTLYNALNLIHQRLDAIDSKQCKTTLDSIRYQYLLAKEQELNTIINSAIKVALNTYKG